MIHILLIISAALCITKFYHSFVEKNFVKFLGACTQTTFYILGAVFSGSWEYTVAVIFGVAGNALAVNEDNSKKYPICTLISLVMCILYIIAVIMR